MAVEILGFNERQLKLFEQIDSLIDKGEDVISMIRSTDEALRKRAYRCFPPDGRESSSEKALRLYGFRMDSRTPRPLELRRCVVVSGYEVTVDEVLFEEIVVLYRISPRSLRRLLRPYIEEAVFESLSNFVSDHEPDELTYAALEGRYKHFINLKIGGMGRFRELFNVDYNLLLYGRSNPSERFISLGLEFEDMVGKYIFSDAEKQVVVGNCRPDFIIGDRWVDTKLSRSTVFDYRDNTIEKYLQRTDDLLIVYALDDGHVPKHIPENVKLTHVSEFYEDLPPEIIAEFEDFLSKAYRFKEERCY